MKRLLALFLVLCPVFAIAQTALPNLSYNALLNAACATPNAVCSGGVFTSASTLTQTGQTGTALDIPANNYTVAIVTVSGTYSGATINFDFSDPSAGAGYFQTLCTRTDVSIIEGSEILPTNQARAWQCPVFGNYRFRVRVSAISSGSINTWITVTQASIDPSPTITTQGSGSAQSAFISMTTATTTQIIAAPAAGYKFYVTGVIVNTRTAGTGSAIQLVYGTGANCGTGTTNLTPAFPNTAAGISPSISLHRDAPLVPAAANAICATQSGTPGTSDVLITGYTAP